MQLCREPLEDSALQGAAAVCPALSWGSGSCGEGARLPRWLSVDSQLSGWDWSLKLGDTWLYFLRKETSLSCINGDIHNLKTPCLFRQHHHFDFCLTTNCSSDVRNFRRPVTTSACPLAPGRPRQLPTQAGGLVTSSVYTHASTRELPPGKPDPPRTPGACCPRGPASPGAVAVSSVPVRVGQVQHSLDPPRRAQRSRCHFVRKSLSLAQALKNTL